jgi:hypothetical protein
MGKYATALAVSFFALSASAEVKTFAKAGLWEAFGGVGDNNSVMCGLSTGFRDGRFFGIKYFKGLDHFTIQLIKPTWNIPLKTPISMVISLGTNRPWSAKALGYNKIVELSIGNNSLKNFMDEFRYSNNMVIHFENSTEPPWNVSLQGTNQIVTEFSKCVLFLTNDNPIHQPFSTPTQPFPLPPQSQPFAPTPTPPAGSPTEPAHRPPPQVELPVQQLLFRDNSGIWEHRVLGEGWRGQM